MNNTDHLRPLLHVQKRKFHHAAAFNFRGIPEARAEFDHGAGERSEPPAPPRLGAVACIRFPRAAGCGGLFLRLVGSHASL